MITFEDKIQYLITNIEFCIETEIFDLDIEERELFLRDCYNKEDIDQMYDECFKNLRS